MMKQSSMYQSGGVDSKLPTFKDAPQEDEWLGEMQQKIKEDNYVSIEENWHLKDPNDMASMEWLGR